MALIRRFELSLKVRIRTFDDDEKRDVTEAQEAGVR